MPLDPARAIGLDPEDPICIRHSRDAVRWAAGVPGFGSEAESFALFLDEDRLLQRAVWLGSDVDLDDLEACPDHLVGYAPAWGVAGVMLLVCRPGEGVEPLLGDEKAWDEARLAHDARGLPLLDVVLVDGSAWQSLSDALV